MLMSRTELASVETRQPDKLLSALAGPAMDPMTMLCTGFMFFKNTPVSLVPAEQQAAF